MIGQALKTKGNDGDRWEQLLQNEIWDIEEKLQSKILPALRLSFNELPPELKRPFTYCSLFPKDYVFHKNKIVLLWMAQGFLDKSNCKQSLESLGHEYFEKLESRSFFQHSAANDELGYTMHDLINDLATSVAGDFFFRLDDTINPSKRNDDETFDKFRHFSLIGPEWKSYTKLKEVYKVTRLRTFLPVSMSIRIQIKHDQSDDVFVENICKLQFLRVINLTRDRELTKVPRSIRGLKHLRYLNFSYTSISFLPEQVGDLYNLHNLLLRCCSRLSRLPKSFVKLTKLRHFDISGTPCLEKMPLGIGGLTSLQTLPKVIIEGANNGFKISDLSGLPDIQSELFITGLDKVNSPIQAKDAYLPERKRLANLEMEWSREFDGSRNQVIEYEVLEQLRPHHHKLRNLEISFYMGMRFPGWVGDPSFDQLTEITLFGCKSTQLPTLGHLPALKKLYVIRMDEVENVGFEFIAPDHSFGGNIAFLSLEVLKFDRMPGWQRWTTTDDNGTARSFPRLREISIVDCPKLAQVSVGSLPSLRVLFIQICPETVLKSMVGACSSLVKLTMWGVKGLTRLHGEDLMHLGALEHLDIRYCHELRYLWEAQ